MMDSGLIFEHGTEDELIAHLDALGVHCNRDPDLDELFIESEVD